MEEETKGKDKLKAIAKIGLWIMKKGTLLLSVLLSGCKIIDFVFYNTFKKKKKKNVNMHYTILLVIYYFLLGH